MKYFFQIILFAFCLTTVFFGQTPSNYSHSWAGFIYPWDMTLDHDKIYVRDGSTGNGDSIKIFETSGNLLNTFACIEGSGLAVDYYGAIYVGAYDTQSETASIKVYSDDTLIRSWDIPLGYDPVDNYNQSMTIRIDRSSNPSVYVLCSDDWHDGTFFKYDRYGNLKNSWEPTAMLSSHSNMSLETNNTLFYILSYNWARIYKYDESGNLQNSWGNSSGSGTADGEFNHPYGIANSIYGIIAVADTDNDRVQFFTSTGTFLNKITSYGSPSNNLDSPRCVALSAIGDWMYVLDNNGIHAFSRDPTSVNSSTKIINYSLSQNYPNPFNPSTVLSYQIPNDGFVSLKVYDLLGKEVATLVSEEKGAGEYSVKFLADKLSGGVYFYQLRAGSFMKTKKMMLLK